jgi:hypothetical protein
MRTVPAWIFVTLYACVGAALLWVALYPFIPVRDLLEMRTDGTPLPLIRGHRTTVPFHLAWWSEGWRWAALPWRLAPALLVGLSLWGAWRHRRGASGERSRRFGWLAGLLITAVGALLFWSGRVAVPIMLTYGDSIALIRQIATANWVFPAEPLMMHLFNAVSRCLSALRGTADGVLAGQLTAIACGVLFLASLWTLALERTRQRREALLLFAAYACTGTATQFFGYIETTLLQTAALAGFLAAAAWTLRAERNESRNGALLATHACMGVLLCAHAAGVALLPALLALWCVLAQRARHRGELRSLWRWQPVASVILGIVVPWIALVWLPFYRHGNFGNSAGGGDGFRFVPWDIEAARLSSDYVYYAMLSRLHAIDLSAALLAAAPLAMPLMAIAVALRQRAARLWQHTNAGLHVVLLVAAVGSASVVLVWDFDFGMWGDWNIVTCYLLPTQVYAWTVFTDAMRQCADNTPGRQRDWSLTLVLPLVLVQLALALGLWLQFHPPGVR